MAVEIPNLPIYLSLFLYCGSSLRLLQMVIQLMIFTEGRNLALPMLYNATPPVGMLIILQHSKLYNCQNFKQTIIVWLRSRLAM